MTSGKNNSDDRASVLDFPGAEKYREYPMDAVNITVPFHDVDVMQVTWHGNHLKYLEIARCAVLKKIDYDYPEMQESGYAWPIVDMRIRYVSPTSYGDQLRIIAIIVEWDVRLVIKYVTLKKDTNKVVARGRSVQVPLAIKTMSMDMTGMEIIQKKTEPWHTKNSVQP